MKVLLKDDHVFLNCPFDGDYRPIFEAVVFAVHDCGFVPRCALEVDDSAEVRIDKLFRIVAECRLGIHDISRTELDDANRLPRFNMPLELGIFLAAKRFGARDQRKKSALILDRERYRYQKFCSDIAGQDIQSHGGDHLAAIAVVRDWLRNNQGQATTMIPGGVAIAARYQEFRAVLPSLCRESRLDPAALTFKDYRELAFEWIRANNR